MAADSAKIAETILELERSLNERWSAGDSSGYLDIYHDDISYFDPITEHQLIGRPTVLEHLTRLYRKVDITRNEYLHPSVVVSDSGDLAVLSYNLNTFILDESGVEIVLRAWNSTEVYRLVEGEWRIVHSNWALTKAVDMTSAS